MKSVIGIGIGDLWLEATRRCNLECRHCCRGDAQEVDMSTTAVEALLKQTGYIGNLGFTGGEPTIAAATMRSILDQFKDLAVPVTTLELVTNGVEIPRVFFYAWRDWMDYCDHPENAQVFVSGDQYHPDVSIDGLAEKFGCSVTLRGLEYVVAEGRACNDDSLPKIPVTEVIVDGNNVVSPVYLNCYGDLLPGVDFSYENQHRERICNVLTDDVLGSIVRWNR